MYINSDLMFSTHTCTPGPRCRVFIDPSGFQRSAFGSGFSLGITASTCNKNKLTWAELSFFYTLSENWMIFLSTFFWVLSWVCCLDVQHIQQQLPPKSFSDMCTWDDTEERPKKTSKRKAERGLGMMWINSWVCLGQRWNLMYPTGWLEWAQ